MKKLRKNLLLGAALPAMLLSGCSAIEEASNKLVPLNYGDDAVQIESAEALLNADKGLWDMEEQEQQSDALDPVAMHAMARAKVNPSDKSKKRFLPQDRLEMAAGAPSGSDQKERVIRLARADVKPSGLEHMISKPKEIVVAAAEVKSAAVIPSKKPKREASVVAEAKTDSPSILEVILGGGNRRIADAVSQFRTGQVAQADAPKPQAKPLRSIEVAAAEAEVSQMRLGEHPDKTRLVLDLSGEVNYTTEIDSSGKFLTVELPHAGWRTATRSVLESSLIAGYTAERSENGDGTKLRLELKKPVKIIGAAALSPDVRAGRPHRIYFDIRAA